MSALDKLRIENIRSFSKGGEVIEFHSPLTLIVGYNGSGKTTIIECLKFALTGIQPPNTKVGGAFVHDPNLSSKSEVLGQVKLGFKSGNGSRFVAVRSLQLTLKKNTRSLKTLEGSLRMERNGETTVVSSRAAELDIVLPHYLGVSTAVLDNVIFCHQDESLWPLSDPSTLKKKFDEIFEAQKYTKAIDNIKQIRKKHNEELGKYKLLEQHAKEDKDRAEKARKNSEKLQRDMEPLRTMAEDLQRRIKETQRLADEAWRKVEDYSKIVGSLEGKRIEARTKQQSVNNLKPHLEEVPESDEWLQKNLDEFAQRKTEMEEDMGTKKDLYLEFEDRIEALRLQREESVKLKGKFEQEKEEYDRNVTLRKEMVKEVASKHQIRGFDDLSDDRLVEEFLFKIQKLLKDQKITLDRARLEHNKERQEAQALVNRLTERQRALQDQKKTTKTQVIQIDRQIGDFQKKAQEIRADEGSKAVIESRVEDVVKKLKDARQVAEAAHWDRKLQDANSEIRALEDTSSRLNDEIVESTTRASEFARLNHLKQELKERQRSLETLMETHSTRLNLLLTGDWSPSTVEAFHQQVLTNASNETRSAERARDSVGRELEQTQFKQNSLRKDFNQKKAQADTYDKEIRSVIEDGPDEYDDALRQAESNAELARQETGGYTGLNDYYEKVLEAIQGDKPSCRTCMRPFKGPADPMLVKMRTRLEQLLERVRQDVENLQIKEVEAEYRRLIDLGVTVDGWRKLVHSELPAMEEELKKHEQHRISLVAKLEKFDQVVAQEQEKQRDVESVTRTVASISQCDAEMRTLTSQINDLSTKQSQYGGSRTAEEIRTELSTTSDKIKTVQNTIERLRSERDQSRNAINSMELQLRDLQGEQSTIAFQLEKRASFFARIEEFRAQNQKHRETLETIDQDIGKLSPEIATATAKHEDVDQRASAREEEMSHEQSRLSESINGLDLLNVQIQAYLDRNGPSQIARVDRELRNLDQELDSLKKELGQLAGAMNRLKEDINNREATRRKFYDNLRYRSDSRDLERLQKEIQELESHNAEEDRDRFQNEAQKRARENSKLSGELAGVMGELKSKDAQLVQLIKDYETDFKDAPQRFKEAHIKVEATKAAIEDLGRYGGALDKAIMKFHGLKMDEINTIIEELWRRTYRGSDIDTIMIRADNETGRGNRSYNYRVVMIKRDAEMDMRGRCSAGQKVLASIIIRLALAECFSSNCGIFALDEPTTNLDRDNIESLAGSLHDIIRVRRAQSNFQLIVITHDEEFLRHMQCAEFTDYYYRVSRNEMADSIIERQGIAAVL